MTSIGICARCGGAAPPYIVDRYLHRPAQWLRPRSTCEGCSLMYEDLGGEELVTKMCSHYMRDAISQTTIGQPWKLFRGDPQPEDVIQGGLGNCWFAGALSVVARMPGFVKRLFKTPSTSRYGAYVVKLCCAGEWREIVVDDHFPTTRIAEGCIDTDSGTIYYAKGGKPCYLSCARRQLWAQVLEKAAAKLFGNYASLESGTFSEALAMLTGFPTERIQLYIPSGRRMETTAEDADVIWARIMSATECGFLIGLGCSADFCEKPLQHVVDMGLQSPHAYGILDARDVEAHGSCVRLLKIRNPQGARAPRAWKGAWGKGSALWTPALESELGVAHEDASTFWMTFEDLRQYFGFAELCRVHEGWHESRQSISLAYGGDPGDAAEVEVRQTTQVDIALWQERHFAEGTRSVNADIGLGVLRRRGNGCPCGRAQDYELVSYSVRTRADEVSAELMLEGGFIYRLVPLSFASLPSGGKEPVARKAVLSVHSAHAVTVTPRRNSWEMMARAAFEGCRRSGAMKPLVQGCAEDLQVWQLKEHWGVILAAENASRKQQALQVDVADSAGCTFSHKDAAVSSIMVVLPACSQQVLMALTPTAGHGQCSNEKLKHLPMTE
eukprot:TRINITY_DN47452_c0_g1_i1.p1 TRINITY_DN47452_c0_g1~~TRINITY_DN47452_c0_g1_i1.p1  ORF type:complete len:611 (+),score=95.94 TRINITY_DN47452_c0_g1_i1:830-2662(+)